MIDGAYSVGIDYDAYRRDDYYQPPTSPTSSFSSLSLKYLIILILIASLLFASLVLYTLTCIPYFDVDEVTIVSLENLPIPPSITKIIEDGVIGESYYSSLKRNIKKILPENELINQLVVQKGKERGVNVFVGMNSVDALFINNENYFALSGTSIVPISKEDGNFYKKDTLHITSNIALDSTEVENLMMLLTEERFLNEDVKEATIGLSEIYFPLQRLTLRIRESISYSRLHYVLQLIRLEREKSQITNISLHSQVCYDVYQHTMRMDEWR